MTSDLAQRVQSQPVHVTTAEVYAELARVFPRAVPPLAVHVTNWSHDPLSYGSYSTLPFGFFPADKEALVRAEGPLLFAGEHCHENHGYVHAALDSGTDAAWVVLDTLATQATLRAVAAAASVLGLVAFAAFVMMRYHVRWHRCCWACTRSADGSSQCATAAREPGNQPAYIPQAQHVPQL